MREGEQPVLRLESWRLTPRPASTSGISRRCITTSGDYDAASPVVLFDTMVDGQPRKALAEAGAHRLGVYTRSYQRQADDRHRGEARCRRSRGRRRRRRSPIRLAMPPCRSAPSRWPATTRRAASFAPFWGHSGAGAAFGHRRHQLVADAVQSGYRLPLRGRHCAYERVRPLCAGLERTASAMSAAPRRRRSTRR